LRQRWRRLIGAESAPIRVMASDTEFWCPMCPGVVSDWPGKCPVCSMNLVLRKKGAVAPLPDGVVARMQFSPYRVQLAGIRTAIVEYRRLQREVVLVGLVEKPVSASAKNGLPAVVHTDAFAADLPFLRVGQRIEASADPLAGHAPFRGEIVRLDNDSGPERRGASVGLAIDDPHHDLPPGSLVTARTEAPILRLPWWHRAVMEARRDHTAMDLALHALFAPSCPRMEDGLRALLQEAATQALLADGMGLAIPHSAVVDHGSRKVAFVENGPGMFDAVEVTVGPRCGDYYPILRGLEAGQSVAATGAFLLDAEMWRDHDLAVTYFGATRSGGAAKPSQPTTPPGSLSAEDLILAAKQKICPVTEAPLDSMGEPVRVEVAGRTVFLCCAACEKPLRKDPAKYLAKIPPK
jgi:membrane fusion protein, copper/silver efflux system